MSKNTAATTDAKTKTPKMAMPTASKVVEVSSLLLSNVVTIKTLCMLVVTVPVLSVDEDKGVVFVDVDIAVVVVVFVVVVLAAVVVVVVVVVVGKGSGMQTGMP